MTAKRARKGFTIVELLMVIAVLAVLMGIVSTAATSVIRKARTRENEALRSALQAGIATYCQQEGYWPPGKSGANAKPYAAMYVV
jgi:prepilin-type N-terminal cleavage/methylation domain-containing protein